MAPGKWSKKTKTCETLALEPRHGYGFKGKAVGLLVVILAAGSFRGSIGSLLGMPHGLTTKMGASKNTHGNSPILPRARHRIL